MSESAADGALRFAPLVVESAITGEIADAKQATCACDSVYFEIFLIDGKDHPRLKCKGCGECYCYWLEPGESKTAQASAPNGE